MDALLTVKLFIGIIFGHFVSDYVLQNKAMAEGKSQKGAKGLVICLVHCLIYTGVVYFFLWTLDHGLFTNYWSAPVIFLSHFPIDRWSLAGRWMKFIKGRGPGDQFFALMYAAVDNTLHIIIMFYALWLLQ